MTPLKSFFLFFAIQVFISKACAQDTLKTIRTEAILYTGKGTNQPLIIAFGGSEGGNAWASSHWKKTRDFFIEKGFAFLAVGYFGGRNTPPILDKIAIDTVYKAIVAAKKNQKIDSSRIAVMGGSRGADLALLLASYYPDISCVIALSASHAVFPGHTDHFTSSCWTYSGKELPFIPVNEAAVPFLMQRDIRGAFEAMLQDTLSEKNALIPVERINGPVLFISAKKDEMIPATSMAEKMIQRLKQKHFRFAAEHVVLEGSHSAPYAEMDRILLFLQQSLDGKNK